MFVSYAHSLFTDCKIQIYKNVEGEIIQHLFGYFTVHAALLRVDIRN